MRARDALLVKGRRRALGVLRELGFFRMRRANMMDEGNGIYRKRVQTGIGDGRLEFEKWEAMKLLSKGKRKVSYS